MDETPASEGMGDEDTFAADTLVNAKGETYQQAWLAGYYAGVRDTKASVAHSITAICRVIENVRGTSLDDSIRLEVSSALQSTLHVLGIDERDATRRESGEGTSDATADRDGTSTPPGRLDTGMLLRMRSLETGDEHEDWISDAVWTAVSPRGTDPQDGVADASLPEGSPDGSEGVGGWPVPRALRGLPTELEE